jgi:uncharacterized integral membrane protein
LIAIIVIVVLYNRDSSVVLRFPFFEKDVNTLILIIGSVIFGFLLSVPMMMRQRKKFKRKISDIKTAASQLTPPLQQQANQTSGKKPPAAIILLLLLLPVVALASNEKIDFKKCEKI